MLLRPDTRPEALLSAARTDTPLQRFEVEYRGIRQTAWLKLELHNPSGSIKYRTALGLLAALQRQRPLEPGEVLIESSSGNLGVALAEIAGVAGWRFLAVIDPKTPAVLRQRMVAHGAELIMVDVRDEWGGYLLNRLETIHRMVRDDPDLRWTDQYHSSAAASIHRTSTVPELLGQTAGAVDAIFAAVSTGGTVAGIGGGLRQHVPGLSVYAVDVDGSAAVGGSGHPHLLSGIGATRPSSLLRPSHYTRVFRTSDVAAIAMCRVFQRQTGLGLGASTGAVLVGLCRAVAQGLPLSVPVLISPDGAGSYRTTVYDEDWLAARGVLPLVREAETAIQDVGVVFRIDPEEAKGEDDDRR